MSKFTGFRRWWTDFQGSELLPIIPPGANLAPGSAINPAMLGKIPGTCDGTGLWHGFGGQWSKEFHATEKQAASWAKSGASIGLQTRIFPAIDIDVEDATFAKELCELAIEKIGDAPLRYRDGSNRRLLLFRIADGETPLRKRRIKFRIGETEHAVELLGFGQQCVVEGPHPKAGKYEWGPHPCECGPSGLPEIVKQKADALFTGAMDLLDLYGYPIVASNNTTNTTTRMALDNPRLYAPNPEAVLELLREYQPDHLDHDEYVAHIAAIKAALGPSREEFKGEVLEWSPGVRSTEDDQFEIRWNSITNSALGWEWLTATARGAGYRGDAHRALIEEAPNDDYFAKLYAWFAAGGTEKVFGWLKQYALAGFNPMAKPPITAAKRTMLDASQPAAVRWLREQLREGGGLAQRSVVTVRELRALHQIADALNARGIATARGGAWYAKSVSNVLARA